MDGLLLDSRFAATLDVPMIDDEDHAGLLAEEVPMQLPQLVEWKSQPALKHCAR